MDLLLLFIPTTMTKLEVSAGQNQAYVSLSKNVNAMETEKFFLQEKAILLSF